MSNNEMNQFGNQGTRAGTGGDRRTHPKRQLAVFSRVVVWVLGAALALMANGCTGIRGHVSNAKPSSESNRLAEFVFDTYEGPNAIGRFEMEVLFYNNYAVFLAVPKLPDSVVVREMRSRMRRPWSSMSLRILAAGTLAAYGNSEGQAFLIRTAGGTGEAARSAVWMIGKVPEVRVCEGAKPIPVDMHWAEEFMMRSLKDRRVLWQRQVPDWVKKGLKARGWEKDEAERMMEESKVRMVHTAIDDGHFPERLAEMKSDKALPLLFELIREGPSGVLCLSAYDKPKIEAFVMEILRNRDPDGNLYYRHPEAATVAAKLGIKQAVEPLLLDLDLDYQKGWGPQTKSIYEALLVLGDASIIPVIEAKLPVLKGSSRDHARLTILRLRSGDIVPGLVELLREPAFSLRLKVIRLLAELKDRRAVPALLEVMRSDSFSPNCSGAIEALGKIGGREAVEGLVRGLELDFWHLQRFKARTDYNPEIKREIGAALKAATGQDLGTDAASWKRWLANH